MTYIRAIQTTLVLITSTVFTSCVSTWSDLPEETSLSKLKQTDFVPTLENPISENKNIVYASAFLYAWDKVEEELKRPVIADQTNSPDFKLLTRSTSHQNSSTDEEYTASVEIVDGAIIAEAFFNKTLPFETKLQVLDDPIKFDQTKVAAFGMNYYDEDATRFSHILYYKDDNHFILKLSPKDKQHEILLAKGLGSYPKLAEGVKRSNNLIAQGKKEKTREPWKYTFGPEDIFAIPVIKFNLATQYKSLEGQTFKTTDNKKHSFEIAYQRTGFILNENGAVVESESEVATDSADSGPAVMRPKKMIFDKEFLIIIKRSDQPNPYFVMKVNNAELLKGK